MDITTLATLAGLFLTMIVGNAAFFGDSLFASIGVPHTLELTGFDRPMADRLFAAEVAYYTRLPTIMHTPAVTTSTAPSVTMALAKPFQLQDVVFAIQSQVRQEVVNVTGTILSHAGKPDLSLLVVIHNPPDPPTTLSVNQPDGDPEALIRKAAREVMIIVAPYRVAISDLSGALNGDKNAIATARQTAQRGLLQPWDPSVSGATELVLLHNLLGILAFHSQEPDLARNEFKRAHDIPGAAPSAYALVTLNLAFLAVMDGQPTRARELRDKGIAMIEPGVAKALGARIDVMDGLIAWSNGALAEAEMLFRRAAAASDTEVEPHYYLARMLATSGDKEGAAREWSLAQRTIRADTHYVALASTIFWMNPVTGRLDGSVIDNLPAAPEPMATAPATTAPATTSPDRAGAPPAR